MTLDEIKTLIDAMGSSDLAEMEVAKGGWTLRLVRHAAPGGPPPDRLPAARTVTSTVQALEAPPPAAPSRRQPSSEMRAPLAGIVYLSSAPDAAAFVQVGETVELGTVLCTIEAMKTFNEIRADRPGVIEAVLIATGEEVEAGQPLFRFG